MVGQNAPAITLKIPSLYDSKRLSTRIYMPSDLLSRSTAAASNSAEEKRESWYGHKRLAIVAHPYAPLGGCYNDHVVMGLVDSLLEEQWVVGTFNFRGAPGSEGKTSWTGKPEIGDYKAVIGGLVGFVHSLGRMSLENQDPHTSDALRQNEIMDSSTQNIELLLAGYSYGSLITSQLPSFADLATEVDSAIERSVEYRTCMAGLRGSGQGWGVKHTEDLECGPLQISKIETRPSYLLVSPLLPPVSGWLTLSMFNPVSTSNIMSEEPGAVNRGKILVIYGDRDIFTSIAKYTKWKETWETATTHSTFTTSREAVGINNAGHIWIEPGAMESLKRLVKRWAARSS